MIDAAVVAALNHLLAQAGWARQRLAPFVGRHARIAMPPWRLSFGIAEEGWLAVAAADAVADVDIALPADTPFLAAQGIDQVLHAARIEGAAQFASELTFVFRNLRWDFEEDASRLFGDIAAHRLGRGLAAVAEWQKRAVARFAETFVARATQGNGSLVARGELAALSDEIAELSASTERSERRVELLMARRSTRA